MRIGLMLRALDERGGVGVYAYNITKELLKLETGHEFFFYYRSSAPLGTFSSENVTEKVLRAPGKALWDQVRVPLEAYRDRLDVLFHPKFTAPLLCPCPVVMAVHGADWFMPDQAVFYHWLDVRYIRTVMPLYFRKCARVVSVSKLTTQNFNNVLSLPTGKVQTVYFGPAEHFVPVRSKERLTEVQEGYRLPRNFFLTLAKVGSGAKRKNFGNLIEGYRRYWEASGDPVSLVVGGRDCERFRAEFAIPSEGFGADVRFPGWIDQQDLPAIYSSSLAYIYPSNLEAFPIPLTEAMATATPIVTSNVNGLEEIAGDAALYVDPSRPSEIAAALARIEADDQLRGELSDLGLSRSKMFSWRRCASEVLDILVGAAGSSPKLLDPEQEVDRAQRSELS